MADWPVIDGPLLSVLVHYFKTPLRLQASFDDVQTCSDLISSIFPDLVAETVANISATLVLWREENQVSFKRQRRELVVDNLCKLPSLSSGSVQESFSHVTKMNPVVLLEAFAKRKQKIHKEEPADVRARRFDQERIKYSGLLAQVIKEAGMPVVALVDTLDDPAAGWIHLFGARRANTLKNRYQAWKPFRVWLETTRGKVFPTSLNDIIDYIQMRIADGCGRSVPLSFHIALSLLEQLGRVPSDMQLSKEEVWIAHVKSWTAELSVDAPPTCPAEMYTVSMLISLELVVVDEESPIYARALAWVVLCMIWGAMRCDDVQAILPHRTLITQVGLRLTLGKTKTTGPDKRQREVAVHVHRLSSLTGEDWLQVGLKIWESDPFVYKRDYMVMEPIHSWDGIKRKFLAPSGLSAVISKLLSTLRVPRRAFGGWSLNDALLLLPDGLEAHFSGHSPRNFLTSVAAVLGFNKDQRAYLGRWAMGMVASEEYVRTSRQVVFGIQKAVCESLVTGRPQGYCEDEAIERLCKTAERGGANPARIRKRHVVMSSFLNGSLGGSYPTLEVSADDWDVIQEAMPDDEVSLAAKVAASSKEVANRVEDEAKFQFFITTSRRTSFRRLHLVGCFVKPSRCCDVRLTDQVTVDDFDGVCRPCKRRMVAQGKDVDHQLDESSSTASSSSTQIDEPAGDEDLT